MPYARPGSVAAEMQAMNSIAPIKIISIKSRLRLPMLALGIPGSPTAAVLLGGLLIWGL